MQPISKNEKIWIDNFVCPNCRQGRLTEKKGRFGIFYGCDMYPRCKQTFDNEDLDLLNGPWIELLKYLVSYDSWAQRKELLIMSWERILREWRNR